MQSRRIKDDVWILVFVDIGPWSLWILVHGLCGYWSVFSADLFLWLPTASKPSDNLGRSYCFGCKIRAYKLFSLTELLTLFQKEITDFNFLNWSNILFRQMTTLFWIVICYALSGFLLNNFQISAKHGLNISAFSFFPSLNNLTSI